tara:strand:- start:1273 stop:1707 length:435 start_codon:yes stop_codon:yes gene_type:complete
METIQDYSYGVIPVRKEGDEWKVFVLHQISKADTYWTFPKGHPEEGETQEESALRELHEETALVPGKLEKEKTFDQQYHFMQNGIRIHKHVSYYIGYIDNPAFTMQEEEVLDARWCTFAEARVLLTYDLAKELLDEVAQFLTGK